MQKSKSQNFYSTLCVDEPYFLWEIQGVSFINQNFVGQFRGVYIFWIRYRNAYFWWNFILTKCNFKILSSEFTLYQKAVVNSILFALMEFWNILKILYISKNMFQKLMKFKPKYYCIQRNIYLFNKIFFNKWFQKRSNWWTFSNNSTILRLKNTNKQVR